MGRKLGLDQGVLVFFSLNKKSKAVKTVRISEATHDRCLRPIAVGCPITSPMFLIKEAYHKLSAKRRRSFCEADIVAHLDSLPEERETKVKTVALLRVDRLKITKKGLTAG